MKGGTIFISSSEPKSKLSKNLCCLIKGILILVFGFLSRILTIRSLASLDNLTERFLLKSTSLKIIFL